MLAALAAVEAVLEPLGYPVHVLSAEGPDDTTTPPVPYLVLEVARGLGLVPDELPLCGPGQDLQFGLRVRAVGYPADSPVKVLNRARAVLAPDGLGSRISVPGRVVDVVYDGLEVASVQDRDMTAANLDRHPSWGVDAYTVHVQTA